MANRFKKRLYTEERIGRVDGHLCYIRNPDGTLFSGRYKTKILPEDLPEWYIHGRYYKRFGYMSAKGITDMLYLPNRFVNHFLKDDFLLVAYGGKIVETDDPSIHYQLDRYTGYDELIFGGEIISILKGARKYSGYDITTFIEQIKAKKEWLVNTFPEEFGTHRWKCDVDELFAEESEP